MLEEVHTWSDSPDIHVELDNIEARIQRARKRLEYFRAEYTAAHASKDMESFQATETKIKSLHNLLHTLHHSKRMAKKEIEDGIKER